MYLEIRSADEGAFILRSKERRSLKLRKGSFLPPKHTVPNVVLWVHEVAPAETGKTWSFGSLPAKRLHKVDFPKTRNSNNYQ